MKRVCFALLYVLILGGVSSAQEITIGPAGGLGGAARAVVVKGDLAYYGQGANFGIADISDRENPHVLSFLSIPHEILDIEIRYPYAYLYLMVNGGFHVVDISDSSQIQIVGSCDLPSEYSGKLDVSLTHAFVVEDRKNVHVVGISNLNTILPKAVGIDVRFDLWYGNRPHPRAIIR